MEDFPTKNVGTGPPALKLRRAGERGPSSQSSENKNAPKMFEGSISQFFNLQFGFL
jgi:hypothetical protein